jgi:hypothetical protein
MKPARAVSDTSVMSPDPTVENTVTVKYKASVRVSGWVRLAAEFRSSTKYVEVNSSRKNGRTKATASAAGQVMVLPDTRELEHLVPHAGSAGSR